MQPFLLLFGELNLKSIIKFHPSVDIGYTIMLFDISGTNISDSSNTQHGFNLNFGIAYDIFKNIFAQVQDNVPDIKFNTNINILKIGLGYRL